MHARLTKTAVEKLVPEALRYNVTDTDFPGLTLRVSPKGEKAFYYVYRHGKGRAGQKRWVRIGAFPVVTVELARQRARELAADVVRGQDPAGEVAEDRRAMSLAEVVKVFLEQHADAKLKPATAKEYHRMAERHVVPVLGRLKLKNVERRRVANLHHSLRETPYLANRVLGFLAKFFSWAIQNGYRQEETNPCQHIQKFREAKRERFLSGEELTRVGLALAEMEAAEEINPLHAAAIRVLLFTGARLSEVLDLEWRDVHLEEGLLRLRDSKTGQKTVHLPAPAVEVLRNLPQYSTEKVFPSHGILGRVRNLRKTWVEVCAKAGLEKVRLHDLRHSFASVAASSGHSLPLVGAVLGHTQPSTTARYAHVAANPVHAVAEDTAARIAAALNGGGKVVPLRGRKKSA